MADIDIIDIEYSMTPYGEVEQILPNPHYRFNESLFSSTELEVMHYIVNKFKETSAKDIADISHREPAWIENIEGQKVITFTYAFDLVAV